MYKKRPIYWLFTSGKEQGFNALIYIDDGVVVNYAKFEKALAKIN